MPSFNRVMLMGNLTRDPELRYTPKGTAVTDIALAINRHIKTEDGERDEVTFVDITMWGTLAETASNYLSKGRPVFIEGRLQLDQWQDKETGANRQRLKVVAETMQFIGPKPEGPAPTKGPEQQSRPQPAKAATGGRTPVAHDPDLDPEADDIPFRSTIRRDVQRSKLNRRIL